MNSANIKTDRPESRYPNMLACSTKGATYSADWSKAQSKAVYKQSLVDCSALFAKAKTTDAVRADYKQLADECLMLLKTYLVYDEKGATVKVLDNKLSMSLVCFQFERYAVRILAGSRECLDVSDLSLGFSAPEKAAKKAETPAKQEPKSKDAPRKSSPAKQEDSALSLILAGIKGLDAKVDSINAKVDGLDAKVDGLGSRMDGVEARLTALENKGKRGTRKAKAEAEAKENVES